MRGCRSREVFASTSLGYARDRRHDDNGPDLIGFGILVYRNLAKSLENVAKLVDRDLHLVYNNSALVFPEIR